MFSNYHYILADGAGHLIRFRTFALCEVEMYGKATTHNKYTNSILHQAFDLSKGVDAGMGDGLHVAQGQALAEKLHFGLILVQHLLAALAVSFLTAHLAADAAEVVISAFHAAADERALHGVKLRQDA